MDDFPLRLGRAMQVSGMNPANLAVWFGRPYPTIYFWLSGARTPSKVYGMGGEVRRRLGLLERAIAAGDGFPIPHEIRKNDRGAYVRTLFARHDTVP